MSSCPRRLLTLLESKCTDEKCPVRCENPYCFIFRLVLDKFSEIMKGNETYARRKVLAGFVMTRGADTSSAQVSS